MGLLMVGSVKWFYTILLVYWISSLLKQRGYFRSKVAASLQGISIVMLDLHVNYWWFHSDITNNLWKCCFGLSGFLGFSPVDQVEWVAKSNDWFETSRNTQIQSKKNNTQSHNTPNTSLEGSNWDAF